MGGKAKPTKHTAAEIAAKQKAATESVGGGKAGMAERDNKSGLKEKPTCLHGCVAVTLTSLTVCKTHWSNKHCTCRRADCECFPADQYEPFFAKAAECVKTHHNQAATLKSNKNASKSVRDKLKAQQAAAAICDEGRKKTHQFTANSGGPNTL